MMFFILMLAALIIYFIICFICGIIEYIKTPRPPRSIHYSDYFNYYNNKEWLIEETEEKETPYYIIDKLAAYDNIIESYNNMLELLNVEYNNTLDNLKRAAIRKKQADLMLKLANIEEKAYKLRETLE